MNSCTILYNLFLACRYTTVLQSLLDTIEFIFGPTTKRFDVKTTMHPYLGFNLTYIDTQTFIPIPAPLAAREEVSGNTGRLYMKFIY